MARPFLNRLRNYFENVAAVLRGEASAASVFANATDVGVSRERIYADFLKAHAPTRCNVYFGGFLFDEDGAESNQLDIIVTTDSAPCFNFENRDGAGKTFAPTEGTLGAFSIKSTLDRKELFDALANLASIPPMRDLAGRLNPQAIVPDYSDWPLKVIYASKGNAPETLLEQVKDFYSKNPQIPESRKVNYIHVAGTAFIVRTRERSTMTDIVTKKDTTLAKGEFYFFTTHPDVQAMMWVLSELQSHATAAAQIMFSYRSLIAKVLTS